MSSKNDSEGCGPREISLSLGSAIEVRQQAKNGRRLRKTND